MFKALYVASLVFTGSLAQAIEVGDIATSVMVDFVKENGQIENKSVSDVGSKKYVVIEFFTSWCPSCAENRPLFAELAKTVAHQAEVRALCIDKKPEDCVPYYESYKAFYNFEHAIDRKAAAAFGIKAIPTMFILNSSGQVVYKLVDVLKAEELKKISDILSQ